MPSERRGTVTEDIAGYIQRLRGTREWRADRAGNIRTPIAQVRIFMFWKATPYPSIDDISNY
jgi:ribosomal protein L1